MIFRQIDKTHIEYRGVIWRRIKSQKPGCCVLTGRQFGRGSMIFRPDGRRDKCGRMIARLVDMAINGIGNDTIRQAN